MRYNRMFHFSAAHFNSSEAYQMLWASMDQKGGYIDMEKLRFLLTGIHGHNFKVEVSVIADMQQGASWLIDDVALAGVVMRWDNLNLSMHPDFLNTKQRATTENMASILLHEIMESLALLRLPTPYQIDVKVYETDDIYAQVNAWAPDPVNRSKGQTS